MADLFIYVSLLLIWAMLFYHAFLMLGGYYHSLKYKNYKRRLNRLNLPEGEYPTVSILIPAHNEEMVIVETIQSMIQLDYPKHKLEVVIINDNSSDQTGSIIDKYAKAYSYIHAVHTKPPFAGRG